MKDSHGNPPRHCAACDTYNGPHRQSCERCGAILVQPMTMGEWAELAGEKEADLVKLREQVAKLNNGRSVAGCECREPSAEGSLSGSGEAAALEHTTTLDCWCEPEIEYQDDDVQLILHRRPQ